MQRLSPMTCAALAAAVLGAPAAFAQTAEAAKPPPCAGPEYRQFDFWVGAWEVRNPAGKVVGHNRIEKIHGTCALAEHWSGGGGVTGSSVNIYDRDHRRWHQTWVDNSGGLLQLDGGLVGTAMVMTGDAFDADAPSRTSRQRITWTPNAEGRVRQLWEASADAGKTWTVVFDGLYVREAAP